MGKDVLNVLGASNHSDKERAKNDYYSTDPRATRALLDEECFDRIIWEPTAGRHMIVNELKSAGYEVRSTDLVDYGFKEDAQIDFLNYNRTWEHDLIFNPPYKFATEFVIKGLELLQPGKKMAVFLRTLFLEGQKRYEKIFKDNPPKTIYVFSKRVVCSTTDDHTEPSAVSYSWFLFEKGYKGNPEIKWINPKD